MCYCMRNDNNKLQTLKKKEKKNKNPHAKYKPTNVNSVHDFLNSFTYQLLK